MSHGSILEEKVYPDLDALSRAAAEESRRIVAAAVAERGRCAISLAGGHTPTRLYSLWAGEYRERMPWDLMHLFWGDERYVPPEDPHSNYGVVRRTLVERVPLLAENVHPMLTGFGRPEDAARAYEETLCGFFSSGGPAFDLELLGVGVDGHTASLFPGSAALEEKERWVVAVRAPVNPCVRLSLTLPALNRARNVFFLVAGTEKRKVLQSIRSDSESSMRRYPAAMVQPAGRVVWFLDQAASG